MPDAAIEPAGHDVNEAVIDDELDRDVGIGGGEAGKARQDDVHGRRPMGVDPDAAGGPRAGRVQGAERIVDGGHGRAKAQQKVRAGLRRRQRPRGPVEKAGAELRFERAHGMAERGGRQAEPGRGPREAAGLDDGREDGEPGPEITIHG
nr:hypothetical protein [Methylobacterium currus]